jgi:hypothetical protein
VRGLGNSDEVGSVVNPHRRAKSATISTRENAADNGLGTRHRPRPVPVETGSATLVSASAGTWISQKLRFRQRCLFEANLLKSRTSSVDEGLTVLFDEMHSGIQLRNSADASSRSMESRALVQIICPPISGPSDELGRDHGRAAGSG